MHSNMIPEDVDLHIHSRFSDGELEPEEIIDRWASLGYRMIAITDHDGIGGSKKGLEYVRRSGHSICFVTGIEFDSSDELSEEIHILGYNIDLENEALNRTLSKVIEWRNERNRKIFDTIRRLGYSITEEELRAVNGGRFTGKPTFARVLVNRGYFSSIAEVFEKLLETSSEIRSIVKHTLSSEAVVRLIHEAGGAAVMAHPMEQMRRGEDKTAFMSRLKVLMDRLVGYGIDGIECYHPSADSEDASWLADYAEQKGLLVTRGSDFHSDRNKRVY